MIGADRLPVQELIAKLEALAPEYGARMATDFERAMREAGHADEFIRERLEGAQESYAREVLDVRDVLEEDGESGTELLESLVGHATGSLEMAALCNGMALGPRVAIASNADLQPNSIFWCDLEVSGDLDVIGNVFVAGSLEVNGALNVEEGAMLIVVGKVRAPAVGGEGWIICAGDVESRFIWGCYEDGELYVRGRATAELAIFQDHGHNLETGAIARYLDAQDEAAFAVLEGELHPDVITEDGGRIGRVDPVILAERAARGNSLFR